MDYERWCAYSNDELRQRDLAEINLAATLGLPGTEDLNVPALICKLNEWAGLVDYGIRRMWRRREAREYRDYSPNQFRILTMVTVLHRNLGVRYNPACMTGEYDARDARDHFIHGPLLGHGGTCSSLPFLYAAIGRRLDFPLFIVEAKEHLFVRWDGDGERFNIEATQLGFEPYDDLHYRFRPRPVSDAELRAFPRLLQNMTPREELACCIAQRAVGFSDNLQLGKAVQAAYFAARLSPIYEGRWATLTMAMAIAKRTRYFDPNLPWEQRVAAAAPRPRSSVEGWAIEQGKQELIRHMTIRRVPRHSDHDIVPSSNFEKETSRV